MVIMSKIKLVFFDMEGVIFESGVVETRNGLAPSLWAVIPTILGKKAVETENKGKEMWLSGKFKNYFEWCEYAFNNYKKHGLTMKQFYGIINNVRFMHGAKETFRYLHKKGYRTVIISGGFKNLANRAIRELGIEHVFAACEFFFDDKTGKLVNWNMLPSDYKGKVDFMKLMMHELNLKPSECAFIGDASNDIPIAKEVGLSIAFNAQKELQAVCRYSINQKKKDLRAILKYLP